MRIFLGLAAIATTVAFIGSAGAEEVNGHAQIAKGDYASAERVIDRSRTLFPHDTDLLLNLATVYARTGRTAEARDLYRDVAARPNERLDLAADRSAWSHHVAATGLKRLETVTLASR